MEGGRKTRLEESQRVWMGRESDSKVREREKKKKRKNDRKQKSCGKKVMT